MGGKSVLAIDEEVSVSDLVRELLKRGGVLMVWSLMESRHSERSKKAPSTLRSPIAKCRGKATSICTGLHL